MIKKIALLGLALVSSAQADSSCDVTSRLYGGVGLGFSSGYAPLLKEKTTDSEGERVRAIGGNITTSYKRMRGLATRLALGGHFVIPSTCLVLGGEMSFGIRGPKGQLQHMGKNNNNTFSASQSVSLRNRWNMAFTGIMGAKIGRILPYAKLGVAIHSFKADSKMSLSVTIPRIPRINTSRFLTSRSKRALFVMGLGVDYNVTKNILVGAEWTHHHGKLGLLKENRESISKGKEKKLDKIRINEFMVTCKYAFPIAR